MKAMRVRRYLFLWAKAVERILEKINSGKAVIETLQYVHVKLQGKMIEAWEGG